MLFHSTLIPEIHQYYFVRHVDQYYFQCSNYSSTHLLMASLKMNPLIEWCLDALDLSLYQPIFMVKINNLLVSYLLDIIPGILVFKLQFLNGYGLDSKYSVRRCTFFHLSYDAKRALAHSLYYLKFLVKRSTWLGIVIYLSYLWCLRSNMIQTSCIWIELDNLLYHIQPSLGLFRWVIVSIRWRPLCSE